MINIIIFFKIIIIFMGTSKNIYIYHVRHMMKGFCVDYIPIITILDFCNLYVIICKALFCISIQVRKYRDCHEDHCVIERIFCFCEHPDVYWISSLWILCDMQSITVPIPYEFTEDVICTKLIVYVSNTITSVRILICIGFVAVVMCIGDTTFLHFLSPIMKNAWK